MKFEPQSCAEFPNDNALLHDGALWVCPWSRARPRAMVPARGVARMLTTRCTGPDAPEDRSAIHPATPLPPVVELPPSAEAAPEVDEAPATLPPPVVRLLDAPPPDSEAVEVQLQPEPASAATCLAPATDEPANDPWPSDEPETAPMPQVAARESLLAGLDQEAERRDRPRFGQWLVAEPPVCELVELVGTRGVSPLASDDEPPVKLSVEEFEASETVEAPETLKTPAAATETREAGAEPVAEPGRPFLVPRPSDLIDERPPQVVDLVPADAMTPLPPKLAVAAQGRETDNANSGLMAVCEDPFVKDLQDLVSELEPAGHAPWREPLRDLEVELTPEPSAVLDRAESFRELAAALAQFALKHGSTSAAAALPRILEGAPSRLDRLPESTRHALAEGGYTDGPDALMLSRSFSSDASRYRAQFLSGNVELDDYKYWLAGFLGAYCGLAGGLDASLSVLEGSGLTRLLNAA